MLSELVNRYTYHEKNQDLTSHEKYGDGWFYLTIEKAEERTCLSKVEQLNGLKILKSMGFIEQVEFGLPCRRYFRLCEEKILNSLGFSKISSSKTETVQLDGLKPSNHIDRNSPTAPIYKEPQEEPNLRQTKKSSVGLSEKKSEQDQSPEKLYYKTKSPPYAAMKRIPEIYEELQKDGFTQVQIDEVISIFKEQHPKIGGNNIVKYLKSMIANKEEENKWAYKNSPKEKKESESTKEKYSAQDMKGRPFANWTAPNGSVPKF
jgi:hypothetical protein